MSCDAAAGAGRRQRCDSPSRPRLNRAALRSVLAVLLLAAAGSVHAAVINAASCSQADVQTALKAAHDGDTVSIPAGTCTWATPVTISKAITLQGEGIDVTTIVDNVPKIGGTGSVALTFNTSSTGAPRATGFTMRGMAPDTNQYNKGTLVIRGTSHSVRVDHIKFDEPLTGAMIVSGDVWGVIDHCIFNDTSTINGLKSGVQIFSENWAGSTYGDGSFEDSLHLGSGQGLYIEDNTFIGSGIAGAGVTDSTMGGRFVFRYNNVTSDLAATHGTQGQRYRGVRSYEFYKNTFTNPNSIMFCAIYLRGGTGVIWGNTFRGGAGQTGYRNAILMANYRSDLNQQPWGICNGSNPWDGNTDNLGYPALDQVGRGTCSDLIRGDRPINQTTGTASWPHNASEPVYAWSNNWTAVPNNAGSYMASQQPVIQAGRDYIDNGSTAKPDYTPYTYPHPLTTGLSPSPPMKRNTTPGSQDNLHKKKKQWAKKMERKKGKQAKENSANEMAEGQKNLGE